MKIEFKISIIITLLGIWLLLFIPSLSKPKLIDIENITNITINKKVIIQANITNIREYDDFQILSVTDNTETIEVYLDKIIDFDKNNNLIIIGNVEIYEGRLQIKATKIISESF